MYFLKISCLFIVFCGIFADDETQWLKFKEDYNKTYSSAEDENSHKQAFFSNVKLIEKHNEDFRNGKSSYEMGINKLTDLLPGEFNKNMILDFEAGILADDERQWLKFKEDYNKTYSSAEDENSHKQAFFSNVKLIEKHNEDFRNGKSSYEMGINEFTDMLPGEFNKNLNFDFEDNSKSFIKAPQIRNPVPDYVNWVERGYTNPVLRQGPCGSCYAFTATAAIEAQYFIRHNELIKLSEQDVLNCGHLYGNLGCKGGKSTLVFKMVKKRGILFANDEPYKAKEEKCKNKVLEKKDNNKPYVKIADYYRLQGNDEEELKRAVAEIGPIAVAIVPKSSFRFYKEGIYYEPNCEGKPNHSLLVVGYGTTEKGEDYWIVRNSWGEDWGKNGYALMSRNRGNNCYIAIFPRYPIDPVIMNSKRSVLKKEEIYVSMNMSIIKYS